MSGLLYLAELSRPSEVFTFGSDLREYGEVPGSSTG